VTPEERTECFDAFDEVKASRTKALVDAVLLHDTALSRALALAIRREDELMCELTVKMLHDPTTTRASLIEYMKQRCDAWANPVIPTVWERLLREPTV
jgi:hypothetical protein